jgi:2-polyprenyl-3-methyl-5-hydroxy-6-metoxy-1,4-benzoquinol methylase
MIINEVHEMLLEDPTNFVGICGTYRVQGYIDNTMHRIPDAPCLVRKAFIKKNCEGKKVLHLGCRGEGVNPSKLHTELMEVAEITYGIDILPMECENFYQMDLEEDAWVETFKDKEIDVVVASEVLEHLPNAGLFLERVHRLGKTVIFTVPNAHCQTQYSMMRIGIEFDNGTHLAKYSYHTMRRMLERYNFQIDYFAWLNWVAPFYAKGLLFVATPRGE